jgi:hypothetical protein
MSRFRITLGLIVALAALAVGASSALAGEFVASKEGKTVGTTEEEQLLVFGPVKIKCVKTKAVGHVAAGSSSTYATSITFNKCLTHAILGEHEIFLGTQFKTPVAIQYHANGFVETGSELEEVGGQAVLSGGEAELKVNIGRTKEFGRSECKIHWPEQTIPLKAITHPEEEFSEATYTNESTPHMVNKSFPEGIQHAILISNEIRGIHFEFEGEPCDEWGHEGGPTGNDAKYIGSFPQLVQFGNLEFKA